MVVVLKQHEHGVLKEQKRNASLKQMEKTMEAEDKGVPIFVSTTNADTHLVISSSPSDTVATIKGKIRSGHLFCFPHLGDIEIGALMVEDKSLVYHLPDSIFVETVFDGSNGKRYLLAEVFGSDLCNQLENKILSDKDENLGIVAKTENAEFHRHLDKISDGTSLDVDNIKSKKKKKKHKVVTESLHVNVGHNNNNEGYTELVAAIDGKAVANDDCRKDVTNPGSGDNITYPMGGNKIKRRKKRNELNEDQAGCSFSPCKEKTKGEQVTTEIENIGHCSSETMGKNIEMDKNSSYGQSTVSAKKSAGDSLKDNGTQNVSMAVEKCEQKILKGNIHTNAGKEHALGNKLSTERKHETSKKMSTERISETSSKIFNEQNPLTETDFFSNELQRKAVNTGKKIKSKRKRALQTVFEDDQGIFCNDVNDPCQITTHGLLQVYKNGKSKENSDKEFDIVNFSKHEKKMVSQHGLGNVDHTLSSQNVDGEHQMTDCTSFLEYKSCKPEEVVAKCPVARNASDKNGVNNNVNIGTVKYLDVSNNTENHQPCTMKKKKKTKHSRHDMTGVDVEERITTEKIPKNYINVNFSKGERDVSTLDTGKNNRRNIPYENGSAGYLNAHNSKDNACGDLEHNTEAMQIPSLMEKEGYNGEEVNLAKQIPSKGNRDRTTKVVEKGMDELVAGESHLKQNGGGLEHVPETLEITSHQKRKDKEIKSSKNSSSKVCQEKTFNIEKRGIEKEVLKSPDAPFAYDNNAQTNNDMSGSVKYLGISNNVENHQPLIIMRKRKMRHSKNDMTLVDAQERITTEQVKKDEMIVNSSKNERDVSMLAAGNDDKRDTSCENGSVKYLEAPNSKSNGARDLQCFTKTIRTTSMVNDEGCNTEKLKFLKNSPSKIKQDSTSKAVEKGTDEVVAKGSNFKQSTRGKEEKQKDSGLKSKNSAVLEDFNTNQSLKLKDKRAKKSVVKNHHYVDQNFVQRRKGSPDVDCTIEKTTIPQFDTNNTNHSLKPDEDIGIQDLKFQSTAEDSFQKLAQTGKLDTNDLSYVMKYPKENQGDAHFTEKIQPENKDVASQKNIGESCGHDLKKKEGSSTAGKTQSSEKNEDIHWVTNKDQSRGADGCYERKDGSVIRHSQKKISKDTYTDSQLTGEECGIDCNTAKLQLIGRTQDGEVMNRARGMNTISREIATAKKTLVDNVSKKNRTSLFRSSSDVTTETDDGIDSYKGSSSSKGSASDSPHSYDSDGGSRDNISKIQSIKLKTAMEPSTNGAKLSTEDGKRKDNGGNGYIHSKFVHILAKKTGLGELFKIARSHQKPESEHFGGDFMADDSPTVDMVLETQESQMDPVLCPSRDRELTASIRADEAKGGKTLNAEGPKAYSALKLDAEAQKTNFVLKSHPTSSKKVSWKSNFSLPINNSAQ